MRSSSKSSLVMGNLWTKRLDIPSDSSIADAIFDRISRSVHTI